MPKMCRPEDRELERVVIAALNRYHDFQLVQSRDDMAQFDATGPGIAVEIKRRNAKKTTYPTLLVSAVKYDALRAVKGAGLYVAVMDDATLVTCVQDHPADLKRGWGGRTDRGLKNDQEVVVYMPLKFFEEMTV